MAWWKPRLVITVTTTVPPGQQPPPGQVGGEQGQQPVPVDHVAAGVHGDDPVGVPVEGQAQVGVLATTASARRRGSVEPQPSLMLVPSGSAARTATTSAPAAREDLRARSGESGPVGAVEGHPQAAQAPALQAVRGRGVSYRSRAPASLAMRPTARPRAAAPGRRAAPGAWLAGRRARPRALPRPRRGAWPPRRRRT